MSDTIIPDEQIIAEIEAAEAWIDHHETIRNTSLDLFLNVRLADGVARMREHIIALRNRLRVSHQPSLFGPYDG